jgi:hypothetical protein
MPAHREPDASRRFAQTFAARSSSRGKPVRRNLISSTPPSARRLGALDLFRDALAETRIGQEAGDGVAHRLAVEARVLEHDRRLRRSRAQEGEVLALGVGLDTRARSRRASRRRRSAAGTTRASPAPSSTRSNSGSAAWPRSSSSAARRRD